MIDQVMFHAAHGRGAARFSAVCFIATLILVATAPFVSAVDLGSATNSCQKENRIANSPGYQPCIELQTRAGTWLYR
jgi:hypothetical protein